MKRVLRILALAILLDLLACLTVSRIPPHHVTTPYLDHMKELITP